MTFSNKIKIELCHVDVKSSCCAMFELDAINWAGSHTRFDQAVIDERILYLNKKLLLINKITTKKMYDCCFRAILRGSFISAGTINDPSKPANLEMDFDNIKHAETCFDILKQFDVKVKLGERKGLHKIYVKDSDGISDFLNIIGAHKCLLEYENGRVLKEMRNTVNRQVNCENANLQKIVDVSFRQVQAINYLRKKNRFNMLPDGLKKVADLRIEHPGMSLSEIGALLDPPLSKAGVSHRLKKIQAFAAEKINS